MSKLKKKNWKDYIIGGIVMGVFFILYAKELSKQSLGENRELIINVLFLVLVLISLNLSFLITDQIGNKLLKNKKKEHKKTIPIIPSIIIFIVASSFLISYTDSFVYIRNAILFGLVWGLGYGIFDFIGRIGMKIWELYSKRVTKKRFDKLDKRFENRSRKN